jgi:hypothetical protein
LDRTLDKFAMTKDVENLVKNMETSLQEQIDKKVAQVIFVERLEALEELVSYNEKTSRRNITDLNENNAEIN